MKNLFTGLGYNLTGLRFFAAHRSLWKYAFIPLILNLLSFAAFFYLYFHFYDDVFDMLIKPFVRLNVADPQGFWQTLLDAFLWFVRMLIHALVFLVTFLIIIVSTYLLSAIVNGPFYELLSERVLILTGNREDKPFSFRTFFPELLHSLKTESIKAAFFIGITALLIAFTWIPVIGFAFTILQFLFSAWFFAFGLCLYPFILEKTGVRDMFRWGVLHRASLIGLGLPTMVPFFGILFMNFQVVGGTLFYLAKRNLK